MPDGTDAGRFWFRDEVFSVGLAANSGGGMKEAFVQDDSVHSGVLSEIDCTRFSC